MSDSLQRLFTPVLYILIFFAGFITAAIWLAPGYYLENLPATVGALAAVALVWLAYVFAGLSLRHRRRESARLAALQQENVRPVLHAVLRPAADAPHLVELAVSNHGKGSARQVRLSIEAVAATPATAAVLACLQPLSAVSDGLDVLAAGESYGGVFADFETLAAHAAPAPFNGIIKVVAEYSDIFDNPCATESVLDMAALAALQPAAHAAARKPRKKLLY
ncbi:hypothetical protein LVJ83_01245 [Uruburuella testudinis]|uniref:Uncharacterized protein n=1 Tax=Uruburuella testudinis TaxID=1282863 RepID=A0ABY4DVS8_9NEIS|nr:hypothetical protein [Uruburuella testudinis]UOO82134.1 hypothetical protein LVJ83_01245 [Uruburuella testudinis]